MNDHCIILPLRTRRKLYVKYRGTCSRKYVECALSYDDHGTMSTDIRYDALRLGGLEYRRLTSPFAKSSISCGEVIGDPSGDFAKLLFDKNGHLWLNDNILLSFNQKNGNLTLTMDGAKITCLHNLNLNDIDDIVFSVRMMLARSLVTKTRGWRKP